jgi:NitT/TauT family transport system substrate-binding protein
VTNEPYFVAQRGVPIRTLSFAEAGYDCYHVIFCRRELIRSAPEVVTAFVAASIRGWRDYIEGDSAPADALILERNPQMTPGQLAFSRHELIARSLVQGDHAKGEDIGQIDLKRISKEIQTLLDLKVLETPVVLSTVAATNFLPKVETKRTTD